MSTPGLDFPELLLEVFERPGLPADFTHISGADSGREDQLGTLGLALNAVIWWNSLCMAPAPTKGALPQGRVLP